MCGGDQTESEDSAFLFCLEVFMDLKEKGRLSVSKGA